MIFIRPFIKKLYNDAEKDLHTNDSSLSYLHCIISLYKSFISYGVSEGIEEVRRSCGNYGCMMVSGLPSLYLNYIPEITYDGDNSILTLQAAKYIMSLLKIPRTRTMPESLQYLIEPAKKIEGDLKSTIFHQNFFEIAARNMFQRLVIKEKKLLDQGITKDII